VAVAATWGCRDNTINYNPATNNDTSPPAVNLLITRVGQPNLEVQERKTPSPKLAGNYGSPAPNAIMDFSILATATDSGSGIKSIKLSMTRTVCYRASSGVIAADYKGSVTVKEATYTDQQNAPVQASVGASGIINNLDTSPDSLKLVPENLLVWKNANQVLGLGVGVSTKWFMEAKNFAGATTYSEVIFVLAGDLTCPITP
jgi:hypothetical protein